MPDVAGEPLLQLLDVGCRIDGRDILRDVSWTVGRGENWAVLGPNGSGKTTIARIAALRLHPSTGRVHVLGNELGRVDVRPLHAKVGYAAAALADQLRPSLLSLDAVMTAKNGALEPWWHEYDDDDEAIALAAMTRVGVGELAEQSFGSLSSGERQRVLISRALMTDPALLILDEPTAALDLGGREQFVQTLDRLAAEDNPPSMILITHHVDEIPSSFDRIILVKDGTIAARGPITQVLTDESLSDLFGLDLRVGHEAGRWFAWADRSDP